MAPRTCRVCFSKGNGILDLYESKCYTDKLKSCVPEIDVYIVYNPGLCKTCTLMLDTAYEFREMCLKNDRKYHKSIKKGMPNQTSAGCNLNNSNVELNLQCPKREPMEYQHEISNSSAELVEVEVEGPYHCNLCDETFSSHYDKIMHNNKLHKHLKHRDLQQLLPPLKGADFTSESTEKNLDITITEKGTDVERKGKKPEHDQCNDKEIESDDLVKIKCDICHKSFKLQSELNAHKVVHSVTCCGESYSTATSLQLHTYQAHNNICGICKEKYLSLRELFNHLWDHIKGTCYKCNVCEREFKQEILLKRHICKYYLCRQCNTKFHMKNEFDTHLKTHETKVAACKSLNGKTFSCKYCHRLCKTRAGLGSHLYIVHKKRPLKFMESKLYECQLCSRTYGLFVHLKMHMLKVHLKRKFEIPTVDCRLDKFYRDQEGLQINFEICTE